MILLLSFGALLFFLGLSGAYQRYQGMDELRDVGTTFWLMLALGGALMVFLAARI